MKQKHLLTKSFLLIAVMLMGAETAWAQAPVNTTLWEETWTDGTKSETPSAYGFEGTTVYGGATLTYAQSSTNTILYEETYAGGTSPELLLSKSNQTWTISNIPTGQATGMSLTFLSNKETFAVTSSTTGITISGSGTSWTITATSSVQNFDLTIKNTGSNNARIDNIVLKVTTAGTGGKDDCDLALTGAPVELSFDLYNNNSAQVINYTTSSTGAVTVSENDYVTTSVDQTNKTITVTPKTSVTPSVQTITVSQAADDNYAAGSVNFSVSIDDSTPIPTHTVTFSVNGTTTTQDFEEGAAITFPANPADVEGKTFVGWTESAITGVTDEAPTFITSAVMGTEALTFYAVFAEKNAGTQTTVTDVLTSAVTGGSSSYSDWSGKTVTSDAVYAGYSAVAIGSDVVSAGAIQLRTTNSNSGIISTTSGGTLKSVTVTWTGNQSRTLDIYGSNTAYAKASDLYDTNKQGTKLGSIVKGTSTSLTVTGDYAYVGIRSNNQALYLDDISIEWTVGTPDTYFAYCTTVAADNRQEAGISFAEAAVTAEIVDNYTGQVLTNPNSVSPITWTSSNEAVATVEDGSVTVLATGVTTIKASFAGDENYKKAEVSYTLTVQDSRQAIDLSFAETSVTVNITETVAAPTLNGNSGNGTVTYESSDETIATVDAAGVVTGVAVGTATITATVAATNEYFGSTATFTVKVVDPNANDGSSVEKAYTVAEAIDVIKALPDNNATTKKYYIKGIVSSFQNTSIVGDGQNYRYFISDDGTTTTQLQVYKGKGLNEATFENIDDLLVGDEVVIYGPIQNYQGKTPEIADGNYLISLNRPVVASIDVSTNLIEATSDGVDGTITVTYNNITDVAAEVYFCDADGAAATYDWIQAEINTENNVYYVINTNDGEARTAYMKVYALDNNVKDVYSKLITIKQAAYEAPKVRFALFTGDLVEGDYVIFYESQSGGKAMKNTVSNANRLDYVEVTPKGDVIGTNNAAIVWHIAPSGSYWTIYSADANAYAAGTGADNKAQMLADGTDNKALWSVSVTDKGYEFVNKANADAKVNSNLRNNGTYGFACYSTSTGGALSLYKMVSESISITAAGYATYCSTNALDFTNIEGLTAYKATVADKQVSFTEVNQVPAGEGVLLKGTDGTYTIPVLTHAKAIENDFEGVTEATEKEAGIFVLMNPVGGKGVGFYKTTQPFTVGANTAYLPAVAGGNGTRTFIGLDEATAIEGIAAEKASNGEVYNLQGQRVTKAQKGLYIVNGKKMVIK